MRSKKLRLLASTVLATNIYVSSATADFLINDDLIVIGSECLGFDCTNGFSFGFNTLVLRENNLRIRFEDTSTAASYPTNDWQITINDSSNGGENYFAVEDITGSRVPFKIRAGAPSNSVYVDAQGDVGLGTSNPVVELHTVDGDTPTVRLDQDGSSGWTPQVWDVAGNEANFFIRDVTNGSKLPFRIRPDAPTDSIRIQADGDVGFGAGVPETKVDIVGGDGTIRLTDTETDAVNKFGYIVGDHFTSGEEDVTGLEVSARASSNVVTLGGGNSAHNAATIVRFFTGENTTTTRGEERMRINTSGQVAIARTALDAGTFIQVGTDTTNGNGASLSTAGVWTDASSRANKINITALSSTAAVEAVKQLNPITYNGKKDSDETYVGFIAEDVPELVAMNHRKGIAAIEVSAVLTSVVKSHQQKIEYQEEKIRLLEEKLAAFERLLNETSND